MNFDLAKFNVMCETDQCANFGLTINVIGDKNNPSVICGSCGQNISNVVYVSDYSPPA